MQLEWANPPRGEEDEWNELVTELRNNPGRWARIQTGVSRASVAMSEHGTAEALDARGIETRFVRTHGIPRTYGELGDLYARAPKEA